MCPIYLLTWFISPALLMNSFNTVSSMFTATFFPSIASDVQRYRSQRQMTQKSCLHISRMRRRRTSSIIGSEYTSLYSAYSLNRLPDSLLGPDKTRSIVMLRKRITLWKCCAGSEQFTQLFNIYIFLQSILMMPLSPILSALNSPVHMIRFGGICAHEATMMSLAHICQKRIMY